MGKRTGADLVPVTDEWADDEDLSVSPVMKYDWTALAEKVMADPGRWLLVDPDGSPSTASNINNGLIVTLKRISERTGMRFRGRATNTYNVGRSAEPGKPRRAKVWIMAVKPEPKRRRVRKS